MTFKEFCTMNGLNYEAARKYKYRHPELNKEQILEFYNQPRKQNLSDLCKKFNVDYKLARNYKRRYPELCNEHIIIHYRQDLAINILGEIIEVNTLYKKC